jgi:hypothetical protein
MGRKALFGSAMSDAERQARRRGKVAEIIDPKYIAARIGHHVTMLLIPARVDLADAALALIARDIAKRRRERAGDLAEYRRQRRRIKQQVHT